MNTLLAAFLDRADVSRWTGLPPDVSSVIDPDESESPRRGLRGQPPSLARWSAGPQGCFSEGVRCWLDAAGDVDLIEGLIPLSAGGEWLAAPQLGEPALRLDAMLDTVTLAGGELVYPDRGLAVRLNPANGLLVALAGFAPTTADDYVRRLRPAHEVDRPIEAGRRSP